MNAGLPRAFGALRSRLGRASESLSASCFNSHLPQFKIENSKFTIPPAFLRPSFRVSSPFGLSEGPSFSDAWRHQYAQLKTQNSQLKTEASPLSLVTPAASDHLLCQASPACACDVHRVRLGAVGSPFAHLAQRRRDGRPSGGRTGAVEGARGNGEVPRFASECVPHAAPVKAILDRCVGR
jgi:hypothetical protein